MNNHATNKNNPQDFEQFEHQNISQTNEKRRENFENRTKNVFEWSSK